MSQKYFSFTVIVLGGLVFRVILIIYGEYHDRRSPLKYTDVDYRVFSDAASFILHPTETNHARGLLGRILDLGDPYARATYRYTPLLALMLTPNELIHSAFGKSLFSVADVLIPVVLREVLPQSHTWLAVLWLFNPMPANIATRGSAESVLGLLVCATLLAASKQRWFITAVLLGVSVHFKIYPFIYGFSLLFAIDEHPPFTKESNTTRSWVRWITHMQRVHLFLRSATTFLILSGVMYLIWGPPFLQHAYLYHVSRTDHRHNFSPYFYALYLSTSTAPSRFMSILSFLPQMMVSMGLGAVFFVTRKATREDLPFIWTIQTMAFVIFNKVCTSQYFMWYLWFLPLVLPHLNLSRRKAIFLLGLWIGSQAAWLSIAYRLEFLGSQVYLPLWTAGMVYVAANSYVLAEIISGYTFAKDRAQEVRGSGRILVK